MYYHQNFSVFKVAGPHLIYIANHAHSWCVMYHETNATLYGLTLKQVKPSSIDVGVGFAKEI